MTNKQNGLRALAFSMVIGIAVNGVSAQDGDCVTFDAIGEHSFASGLFESVIEINGSMLYGGHGWGGFTIFDISTPTQPVQLGLTVLGDYFPALNGIVVHDNLAYVSVYSVVDTTSGLYVVDIADPTAPTEIGYLGGPPLLAIETNGTIVYTIGGDFDGLTLRVNDVSDPSSPTLISSTALAGSRTLLSGMEIIGNLVYIANSDAGLVVYDVSDPLAPLLVGALDTQGVTYDLQVHGGIAYLADGEDGLKAIDVSVPSSPVLIGSYPTDTEIRYIDVQDNTCYATVFHTGVIALDIEDPSSITLLGTSVPEDNLVADIVVHGEILYSADVAKLRVDAITNTCGFQCSMDRDCPADMNRDGFLNTFDISQFLASFAVQDPEADFTCDGEFNFFDVSLWLNEFIGGCQ